MAHFMSIPEATRRAEPTRTREFAVSGVALQALRFLAAGIVAIGIALPAHAASRDLNGDGKSDLVWHHEFNGTAVWLMDGLAPVSAGIITSDPEYYLSGTGDFNGDGKADLLWSAHGHQFIWLMDGLTPIGNGFVDAADWNIVRFGDFNGDGKTDLVWRNYSTGQTAIWLMNGVGPGSSAIVLASPEWFVAGVGDFNGDGKDDLLWNRLSTNEYAVWLMDGVTPKATRVIFGSLDWSVSFIADFNGDGKDDLVWTNSSAQQTAIWLMDGVAPISSVNFANPPDWYVANIGDFNGDGKADLLWKQNIGNTAIWLMDGLTPISTRVIMGLSGGGAVWEVVNVGDYNHDGKSDLVWCAPGPYGGIAIWLMDGVAPASSAMLYPSCKNWLVTP
ncbi:MAG: VCBS repeat-containing protein [Burkholderiales bacterium]